MRSPRYRYGLSLMLWMVLGIGACTVGGDNGAAPPGVAPPEVTPTANAPTANTPADSPTEAAAAAPRSDFRPLPLPENSLDSITLDPLAYAQNRYGARETVEGHYKEFATVLDEPGDRAVVVFTRQGLADDSVRSIRYRLEFLPTGDPVTDEQWQLVWLGQQFICWPGRGQQDWGMDYCI